jgi:hypothetical protein
MNGIVQSKVDRLSHVLHHSKQYRGYSKINLYYSFHLVKKQIHIVIFIPKVNCNCLLLFANMSEKSNVFLSVKYFVIMCA